MSDSLTPVVDLDTDPTACCARVARFPKARGIDRISGLQGGHIRPIRDHVHRLGIRIVDVRHEAAAVHMAHAHAELTGTLGVAMVTAGPGVTNTVTAVANTALARAPVLPIGGCPPRPQATMGPPQDIPHVDILRPVTRHARTLRVPEQVVRELDEAVGRAQGDLGEPGPVHVEIPTDVLRASVPEALVLEEWMRPEPARRLLPDPAAVEAAVEVLWSARRPLVITGRGARAASAERVRLPDVTRAVCVDTQESRGFVPGEHPSFAKPVRGRATSEADLVMVIGRKLDDQLGYGSPAVFTASRRFVRIADTPGEPIANRRGYPEILADPALALAAIVERAGNREPATDRAWAAGLRRRHEERAAAVGLGSDGKIHPMAIFAAIRELVPPDHVAVADGGDLLSFARVGLESETYPDAGAFGCLGVGVPFAIAAALAFPGRPVISLNGDDVFGINAIEVDTAVRHRARAVFVVSDNGAWNIERFDQEINHGGRVVGTLLGHADYASLGRALGAHGERAERPDDLRPALARAFERAPAVVDVVTSRFAVSSDARKGLGFVPDLQPLLAWDEAERRRRGR